MESNNIIKSVIIIILGGIVLFAMLYNSKYMTEDSIKFKQEYEKLNGEKTKSGNTMRTVTIETKNPIIYQKAEDIVKRIDKKETFVVYFGFAECPWCRSVIEPMITSAEKNKIDKIYYVNVLKIRDNYELDQNDNPTIKTNGSKGYKELIKRLENILDNYTLETKDGTEVDLGEKRIYAPNVIGIVNGEAKILETGISEQETNPYMKLTRSMKKDSEEKFNKVFELIK